MRSTDSTASTDTRWNF